MKDKIVEIFETDGSESKNKYLVEDLILDEVIAFDFNNSFYLVLKINENSFCVHKLNSRFESDNYTAYNDSILLRSSNNIIGKDINISFCQNVYFLEDTEEDVIYAITNGN